MAIGAALAAGKATGLTLKALKAFYASKAFWPTLFGAGYLGSTGAEAYGQAGERGLAREQMGLQAQMGKASAEATERTVKESRARTKEYMKTLLKVKKEERKEAREFAALQSFTESQNRQMALVLQAVQTLSQRQMGAATQSPGAGMVGLMKGAF